MSTAYPLQWPLGWPRTNLNNRQHGTFRVELHQALRNLRTEIERMGGQNVVLSSNASLGEENPKDTGVVAYFDWNEDRSKHPPKLIKMAIPCDRWLKLAHNVQAIALTVEAMRGMNRWGAKHMIKAMFNGFKALPAPADSMPWYNVLGLSPGATAFEINEAYRNLAKKTHPDAGGEHEEFLRIKQAYDQARELGLVAIPSA